MGQEATLRTQPEGSRYRNSVDSGRTHDKIAQFDPAAAPVHADAEASGEATPAEPSERSTERQRRLPVSDVPRADHATPGRGQVQIPGRRSAWLLGTGFAALGLLGLAVAFLSAP